MPFPGSRKRKYRTNLYNQQSKNARSKIAKLRASESNSCSVGRAIDLFSVMGFISIEDTPNHSAYKSWPLHRNTGLNQEGSLEKANEEVDKHSIQRSNLVRKHRGLSAGEEKRIQRQIQDVVERGRKMRGRSNREKRPGLKRPRPASLVDQKDGEYAQFAPDVPGNVVLSDVLPDTARKQEKLKRKEEKPKRKGRALL